jgi:DNA-binding response OmpR family regulator
MLERSEDMKAEWESFLHRHGETDTEVIADERRGIKLKRVLLVEDNPADVRLVEETLPHCANPVHMCVATNGWQGAAALTDTDADLVILDINLPGLSGFELLAHYLPETVPVVVFSSSDGIDIRDLALHLGAKEYVCKPTDVDEFVTQLAAVIDFHTS